jgi:hypothetical protein
MLNLDSLTLTSLQDQTNLGNLMLKDLPERFEPQYLAIRTVFNR